MKSASNALLKQRRRASLLVACLVLIWGCNWPVNKVVLSHISPLWFACLRVAMGSVSLFLVQAFRTEGVKLPARADLPVVLSIGLVQVAAVMALVQLGLANVPAGRSAILSYTTPVWVVPGAILILGERLRLAKSIALLLGLAGVAVMFNPAAFDWSDHAAVVGNGYLLAAAALWAGSIIHVRAHRWQGTPLTLAPWQMLIGLIPVRFGLVGRRTTSAHQFFLRHLGSRDLQRPSNHRVSVLGLSHGFSDFARGDDLVDSVACARDRPTEFGHISN
jgi:drug/metabolite transporter (DMT)-like permease